MQYLSCFACKEIMSEPVLLPCLHLFCKKCLQESLCPFCFQAMNIPPKVNYSLIILINHLNAIDDAEFGFEYSRIIQFCEEYGIKEKTHLIMMKTIELRDCFKFTSNKKKKRSFKEINIIC